MKIFFGKCGNNCSQCALHVGNLTDDKREWVASGMRYINWNPTPEKLKACAGCQNEGGFHYLPKCPVRQCAQYNGLETCATCGVYPCRDVPNVSLSVDFRDRMAERLGEPIHEDDYLAFIEPYEGIKHLDSHHAGLSPQDLIPPKGVQPLRTRVSPFIDGESHLNRNLYDLMVKILRGEADLYVRQVLLRKRRDVLLFVLWIFGRHGEFDEGDGTHLVITNAVSGTSSDPQQLIRKRDNTFYHHASVALLNDFDLHVEHVPLDKKRWVLKLRAGASVGGIDTLRSLKAYVKALADRFGEPEYAGSYKLRGEAYTRFRVVAQG